MKPDKGLFQPDFDDHHAALGLPISADTKVVRKRYLAIARKLHPDSLGGVSPEAARHASEVLSKLVNPAYEVLSQEKPATEHALVLKLKGQSLSRSKTPPTVTTAAAQALLTNPNYDSAYRQAVNALAENQFNDFSAILETIGALSELNLVYLYRAGNPPPSAPRPATPKPAAAPAPGVRPQAPPPRPTQTILESYINRAQGYEQAKDYSRAILEMREAIKSYPNDGQCHSYLATLYCQAGQSTMARIHAKRALDINPSDDRARTVQSRVDRAAGASAQASGGKTSSGKSTTAQDNSAQHSGAKTNKGGGFFGLFGGKKKS